jgi:hypothetical protein
MNSRGQSALEYLMTYGWALVVIAIVIGALVFLMGQSTNAQTCTMSPAAGGIGYLDHSIASNGTMTLKLRNDSGKTIRDVNFSYSGGFGSSASLSNGPYTSGQEFTISAASTGVASGSTYQGVVTIAYARDGVNHSSTASCTGKSA